ncbi:MAG: LuxR C-terminal-related transcriptional regulator [Gulosibacter sp.]|uniref:LuxR C-terminal-related transcriptional regulator n=1 Tax=Gulosibacter sp. TaxID=2817531 RepID=UPI003F92C7FC
MARSKPRSEYELLEAALTELGHTGTFPLVFGGLTSGDGLRVSSLRGNETGSLAGLHVVQRRGLGGQALSEMRPRLASDYRTARHITHDYDHEVLAEGVTALLAVPVMVEGNVRGMLYGAEREGISAGNHSVDAVVRAAAWLQEQLRVRDEAERERLRIELRRAMPSQRSAAVRAAEPMADAQALPAEKLEELRASYADLRAITASLSDPALIERMRQVEARLAAISQVDPTGHPTRQEAEVLLSPREVDVLGYVAIGLNNGEIAQELALAESTIKSYLAAAMRKLGQRTRLGAATEARRLGLIP